MGKTIRPNIFSFFLLFPTGIRLGINHMKSESVRKNCLWGRELRKGSSEEGFCPSTTCISTASARGEKKKITTTLDFGGEWVEG